MVAVDISLQNATIFVNLPFLLPLLEYFTAPPPDNQLQRVTTASQTFLDAAPVSGDVTRFQLRGGVDSEPEPFSQVDGGLSYQMKISVHGLVKEPDIVLLSDATREDSEALIVQVSPFIELLVLCFALVTTSDRHKHSLFQTQVEFDYKMENEKQMLSANLTDLQMQAARFPDVKKTSYKVMNFYVKITFAR